MRFVATLTLWLFATVSLAVAVPAVWAESTVVDEDGYAALAASAAADARLQAAMANELTSELHTLAARRGYPVNPDLVHQVAVSYTGNAGFPGQFAQANRIAHRWMFTDSMPRGSADNQWLIDIAPMLSDPSFKATLGDLNLDLPDTLMVPITVPSPELRPGKLRVLATWGPWVSGGAAVLAGVCALLTVVAARMRSKAVTALGVSALIVGAAGWAALEVVRPYIDDALNRTTGDIRQIAEVMVGDAESSLHLWLNLTMVAGIALVALGAVFSMVGSLWRTE